MLAQSDIKEPWAAGVYFVECEGFIKIGISWNVLSRYRSIRSSNPNEVIPLGFIHEPDPVKLVAMERELHERFKTRRHRGEWFCADEEIRRYIAEAAQVWPGSVFHVEHYVPVYPVR